MSEAPERIWVKTRGVPKYYEFPCEDLPLLVEYVRADRIEELEAKLTKAVKALGGMVGLFSGYSLLLKGMHLKIVLYNARAALAELKGQDNE